MKKRVCILSDFHCGSNVGLTPPEWQRTETQTALWNLYVEMIDQIQPIDVLIVNGDAIDGKATRWGGTGMITIDRVEQVEMATQCIEVVNAKEIYMTHGTRYHVGSEDWESLVAEKVGAKIEDQLWLNINGVVFDIKHFISGSQVPYGRHTPLAKDRIWNLLWSELEQQPKSDVLIRSHVHAFNFCGGSDWLALVTPSLQGLGSKFGARIPSGIVDFGIVWFNIEEDGTMEWDYEIVLIQQQKSKAIIVGEENAKN